MRPLRDYQEKWSPRIARRDRVALFWDTRLGKTLMAIRWALLKQPQRVLVVAPLTPLTAWELELATEDVSFERLQGLKEDDWPDLEDHGWYLTTPEVLRRNDWLADVGWDVVILDESTFIANPSSIITKLVTSRFQHVPYRMILAAEPTPEHPLQIFTQMLFLLDSFMGYRNYWEFRNASCRLRGYKWYMEDGWASRVKDTLEKRCFYLTREQSGWSSPVSRVTIRVPMPKSLRAVYQEAETQLEFDGLATGHTVATQQWVRQIAGGLAGDGKFHPFKIKKLMDRVQHHFDLERQVLVWFAFTEELMQAHRQFVESDVPCGVITGEVSRAARAKVIARFREGRYQALLLQARCARFGINCSAAGAAIFYSRHFDYLTNFQAEDRTKEHGKENTAIIEDLVTSNSIDEDILNAVRDKKTVARSFRINVAKHRRARHARTRTSNSNPDN